MLNTWRSYETILSGFCLASEIALNFFVLDTLHQNIPVIFHTNISTVYIR